MEKFVTIVKKRKSQSSTEQASEGNDKLENNVCKNKVKSPKKKRKSFCLSWDADEELQKWLIRGPYGLSRCKGQQQEFFSNSLHHIFQQAAVYSSQKIALIYMKEYELDNFKPMAPIRQTSYNFLNKMANQCARFMIAEAKKNSMEPNRDGDFIIGVCMQPSDHLIIILLSILKAGAAYLAIDPSFPANRVQHILIEALPILVIRDDEIDAERFGAVPTFGLMELFEAAMELDSTNLADNEMLADGKKNLAIVLYTSGSTGVPKGVRLPHNVILNRLQWQWNVLPYKRNENVCIFKTALTFVDSIAEIWAPLLSGLPVLAVPKHMTKDPEILIQILEDYKICRLTLVPTLLRSLLTFLKMSKENKLLQNLKMWICSGEPLPFDLTMSFFDYYGKGRQRLYNFYGSTEVMGDVTFFCCKNKKILNLYDRVPLGKPIFNTILYILDSDYKPVKIGEIGEIFVAGLNLAEGYVNGRSPEQFIKNPLSVENKYSRIYRTGDYGYATLDGNIMYEGRTDSQIKIRGHRVDLAEVEKHVSEMSMVDKAITLCYHPDQVDQSLLTFVKLRDDASITNEMELEAKLKDKLADYMLPQLIIIDQVPLLVNGKVDRQALLKLYETRSNDTNVVMDFDFKDVPEALKKYAEDLFETVASVLGRSMRTKLTIHSNFYELGGSSLNSILAVTLLREKGYKISPTDFIIAKNLGELLEKISNGSPGTDNLDTNELMICPYLSMEALPLEQAHKDVFIKIHVESLYEKCDLGKWLKPDVSKSDYVDAILPIWDLLVKQNLSFVVRDRKTNKIIGTALNLDGHDEPECKIESKLIITHAFMVYIEEPIKDNYLPKGKNKILHSCMMSTDSSLNAQENIACIFFMEKKLFELAKRKGFVGILATNTSPLTQQLASNIHNYKTLLDYQVNEYIYTDGTKPFGKAPDSQRAIVHWKEITN